MSRDTDLNINVTARDSASQVIRDVKDDAEQLEQTDATVDIDADDNASQTIDDVESGTRDLDGQQATVDVQADDNASRVLDDVKADTRDLDGSKAEVTVTADDNASRVLENVEAKLRDLDGRKASIGVGGAVAAGAAAGAAAGSGIPIVGDILENANAAGSWAIQVQAIANATGATLEDASRLAIIWRDAGLDLADLEDLMGNLNQVIRDNPELAEQLGLSTANDGVTTFLQAVKGLQTEFDNAGDRGAAASQLFGEEGVRQVRRVEVITRGDLQAAFDGVSQTRLTNDSDVDNAIKLNEQATELRSKWEQIQLKVLQTLNLLTSKELDDTIVRKLDELGGGEDDLSGTDILNALGFGGPGVRAVSSRRTVDTGASRGARGGLIQDRPVTIINNPPGSPASVVQADEIYRRRNDVRLS